MRTPLIFILLAILIVSACSKNPSSNTNTGNGNTNPVVITPFPPLKPISTPDPSFKACNSYFALVPGSRKKFLVAYSSGVNAEATVVVDAWEENGRKGFKETTQLVDSTGGYNIQQTIERHYVCDGDKVEILYEKTDGKIDGQPSGSEFFYRPNSYAMIEPSALKPDATWSLSLKPKFYRPGAPPAESDVPTIVNYTVLKMDEEVPLMTGKVKGMLVLRKVGEALINDYFVPGLGFVRRNAMEGNKWELKEYSGIKPVEMPHN